MVRLRVEEVERRHLFRIYRSRPSWSATGYEQSQAASRKSHLSSRILGSLDQVVRIRDASDFLAVSLTWLPKSFAAKISLRGKVRRYWQAMLDKWLPPYVEPAEP